MSEMSKENEESKIENTETELYQSQLNSLSSDRNLLYIENLRGDLQAPEVYLRRIEIDVNKVVADPDDKSKVTLYPFYN